MLNDMLRERLEERCHCGHFRSEHAALQYGSSAVRYSRDGYGPCACSGCSCKSFRWLQSVKLAARLSVVG